MTQINGQACAQEGRKAHEAETGKVQGQWRRETHGQETAAIEGRGKEGTNKTAKTSGSSSRRRCRTGRCRWCQDGLHRTRQPRENGYIESFNARLRDELLNGEIFYTLCEAQIVIES